MFMTSLIRVDFVGEAEVRTVKATFIGSTTELSLKPLQQWFKEKERRVRMYLAGSKIYPQFELQTIHADEVVMNSEEYVFNHKE